MFNCVKHWDERMKVNCSKNKMMDVKSTEGIITRGEFINTYLQIQIPIQRKSYTSKSQFIFSVCLIVSVR